MRINRMVRRTKILYKYKYIFIFIIILLAFLIYMIAKGAINYNRILECKAVPERDFCGIKQISLAVPEEIRAKVLDAKGGKRVVIPGWKAGRTISTGDVKKTLPELFEWYKSLEGPISDIIGARVYVTADNLPTTCAVLIYEEEGDFINWHYDVNYFNGRFFTLIIPCTFNDTCTEYMYHDKDNKIQGLKNTEGVSILFEGDKVFHMASKFCKKGDKKRIGISVQFSTDPTINWYNRAIMRIKDIAYIG